MNLYILDNCPIINAIYHTDADVEKVPHRAFDVLHTALQLRLSFHLPELPEPVNVENVWVRACRDSQQLYTLVAAYALSLCAEHKFRFREQHEKWNDIQYLAMLKGLIKKSPHLEYPLVVPKDCESSDLVQSYRTFYKEKVARDGSWFKRKIPYWIDS